MTCQECECGITVKIVGNGITEPPYLSLIRCPYDSEYYKNPNDVCTRNLEIDENRKIKTQQKEDDRNDN